MKISTAVALGVLCTLAQVDHGWARCQEQCVTKEHGCKALFGGALDFEKRYKFKKGESCTVSGMKGHEMATCCDSQQALTENQEKKQVQETVGALAGAEIGEYPHQVNLRGDGACGGTVYNKEWIITAAHCITFADQVYTTTENGYVIAGKTNRAKAKEEDKFKLEEIIVHEQWNPKKIGDGYDIALLKLARPLPLAKGKIQPMRLESENYKPKYNGKGITIGFGVTGKAGQLDHLKEFEVPIHEPSKAARLSFDPLNAPEAGGGMTPFDQILSVAGEDSGYTVGQGDSGGPFICPDQNGKPILCGIASFKQCDKAKMCRRPSYFLRVAPFLDWIREKTDNAKQEQGLLVDEPMSPINVPEEEAPGYLVRVSGPKESCMGTLVAANKVITSARCVQKNIEDGTRLNIYHFKSKRGYRLQGLSGHPEADPDTSANITKWLHRPLPKNDMQLVVLKEHVKGAEPLKLPPSGYQIKSPAVEYTMDEKAASVQKRRFLPMDEELCGEKLGKVDSDFQLDKSQLCMRRVYSAEANCERDVGGPLVCEGKYFCGFKIFHACFLSGLPEIFNNHLDDETRGFVEQLKKAQ